MVKGLNRETSGDFACHPPGGDEGVQGGHGRGQEAGQDGQGVAQGRQGPAGRADAGHQHPDGDGVHGGVSATTKKTDDQQCDEKTR